MIFRISFYTEPVKVSASGEVEAIRLARRRVLNRQCGRTHRIALIVKKLEKERGRNKTAFDLGDNAGDPVNR